MKQYEWISIPNWDEFQHYRDRDPKWIKVYNSLLNKPEYLDLSSHRRAVLHGIWLLYAASNARVPFDARSLSRRLQVRVTSTDLRSLVDAEWINITVEPEQHQKDWASRYISKELRAAVLDRDGRKCLICGATKPLEIDHIVPISRGGTGELANLQTLRRPCNRSKHNSESVSHLSSNGLANVVPEEEGETEEEKSTPSSNVVQLRTEEDGLPDEEVDQLAEIARLTAAALPDNIVPF